MEFVNFFISARSDIKTGNVPLQKISTKQSATLVLLLAPFAPFVASELWEVLGEEGGLLRAPWPKYDPELAKEDEIQIPVQVNGKLRSVLTVPADASEETIRQAAFADEKVAALTAGKPIVKTIVVPKKLVNIVVK